MASVGIEKVEQVHVRKWRREVRHVGPGGHIEIQAWIPEVPHPTEALQASRLSTTDTKSSTIASKKALINTRKRIAPTDGTAARMTRSLRHNTTSGTELWGELPPMPPRTSGKKEDKKVDLSTKLIDEEQTPQVPEYETKENTNASVETSSVPDVGTPINPSPELDYDDDDDDGYISPISSPDASSSPIPSPDTA